MNPPSKQSPPGAAQIKTPVVFSMGKVASTALNAAFSNAGLPSHHIHNLDTATLLNLAMPDMEAGRLPLKHISQSMAYKSEYREHPERFLFISLVRDPVARNISAFFQNLYISEEKAGVETDVEALFERFQSTYAHSLPLFWFDQQFYKHLGINIYDHAFDKENKCQYLPKKNTLLLRVDCPRADKEKLLTEIFKLPIHIPDANVGERKNYSDRYKAFKAHARFDDGFLGQIYDSPFCRHFWTDQERDEMRAKWAS